MGRKRGVKGFSEHHLTPKSRGGKGGPKTKVPNNKHVAWHTIVGTAPPPRAATILSGWIDPDYKFFAVPKKGDVLRVMQEINQWLKGSDVSVKVISKKQPKIIRFHSLKNFRLLPKIVS